MLAKSSLLSAVLGTLFVACLLIAPAHAQATRTWVSGVGDDANPCSRTAPCKTFAGAISKTATAGEINVLDPGGFGAVTITKSISIYNDGVGEAGVLVSGTNGIVIASPAVNVYLRGLIFDGLGTGLNGVLINSASRVEIMNCVIQQFGTGSGFAGVNVAVSTGTVNVKIQDTTIINNNADGVLIKPTGGAVANVVIDKSAIDNNTGTDGVRANANGGGTVHLAVSDSSVSLNLGNGIAAVSGSGQSATVDVKSHHRLRQFDGRTGGEQRFRRNRGRHGRRFYSVVQWQRDVDYQHRHRAKLRQQSGYRPRGFRLHLDQSDVVPKHRSAPAALPQGLFLSSNAVLTQDVLQRRRRPEAQLEIFPGLGHCRRGVGLVQGPIRQHHGIARIERRRGDAAGKSFAHLRDRIRVVVAVQRLHRRPEACVAASRLRIVPNLRPVLVAGKRQDVGKRRPNHAEARRIDAAFLKRYPEVDRETGRMHEGVEVRSERRQPMRRLSLATDAAGAGIGADL